MDKDVKRRFKLSLLEVIYDPASYISSSDIERKLASIGEFVDSEMNTMIENAKQGAKDAHNNSAKAEELSRRMGSYIKTHAKMNNIPIVKPSALDVRVAGRDRFYFGAFDSDTTNFIERLIESSSFVIDMSETSADFNMGEWLFSGEKDCIVGVHVPRNSISLLKQSKADIQRMIKETSDSIKGL